MQNNPTPTQTTSSSDEIDLHQLFSAIGRFFGRIGRGIVNIIISYRQATRRFWLLILICILLGGLAGFLLHQASRPYYQSKIQLTSTYYKGLTLGNLISSLNQLAEEENYLTLAQKLNISNSLAENIRTIDVEFESSPSKQYDIESLVSELEGTTNLNESQINHLRSLLNGQLNNFNIVVTFYELDNIEELEEGLVSYLNNNSYIKRRVQVEQQNLLAMREKLQGDQVELQALKKLQAETIGRMIETSRSGSNNVILGTPDASTDPLNVYREDIRLYEQLLEINRKLELNRSVEVISGFTAFSKPASVSLFGKLVYGALIGLGAAYVLILLIGINKALNRYEAKQLAK